MSLNIANIHPEIKKVNCQIAKKRFSAKSYFFAICALEKFRILEYSWRGTMVFCWESALSLQNTVVFLLFLGVGYMNKIAGQIRIPSGCAISAVISKEGKRMTGEKIIESMKPMHDRSNGLGGGFAAYGIYPAYKDFFGLNMFEIF